MALIGVNKEKRSFHKERVYKEESKLKLLKKAVIDNIFEIHEASKGGDPINFKKDVCSIYGYYWWSMTKAISSSEDAKTHFHYCFTTSLGNTVFIKKLSDDIQYFIK
jgi:hypothetical protein